MRITGGMFGGRRLKQAVVGPGVRPTQDRVREALFSSLAGRLPGCSFLDLYAGTGAVGIEAWSRGARRVCWVERSVGVFRVLKEQIQALADEDAGVQLEPLCMDAMQFCRRKATVASFDLIYADPPYARGGAGVAADLLVAVGHSGLLAADGVLILEQGAAEAAPCPPEGWSLLRERRYGGSCLRMYGKEESE